MTAEHPHHTYTVGRLFFGPCRQAGGAPVIDSGTSWSKDGWSGGCLVIRLRRTPGLAFQIGLIGSRSPSPHRLARIPVLGLPFRARP